MRLSIAHLLVGVLLQFSVLSATGQAVWKQYNGPFSGEITSMVTYGDTLFGGSTLTGTFKSIDGGKKWSAAIPEVTYVHSLYTTDTSLLVGSDKLWSYSEPGKPLKQLGQALPGVIGFMHSFNGSLFVSSDYGGVYKYDPASNKLVAKNNGLTDFGESLYWTRDLVSVDDALFCNVIGAGLYKSVDEGESWAKVTIPGYAYGFNVIKAHHDSLFCAGDNVIFISTDKGVTWTNLNYNLTNPSVSEIEVMGSRVFISGYYGVYRLDEGQVVWSKINDKQFDTFHVNGKTFLANDRQGVYRWDEDTEEFVLSNEGVNTSRVNEIELFNGKLYSATERGVHFTSTDGDDWSVVPELADVYIRTIAKKDTFLFAGTTLGLYRTSTTNTNWDLVTNGLPDAAVWDIEVSGNNIFVATDDGVYVSRNSGNSWTVLPNTHSSVSQLIYLGVNDTILVAGNTLGMYKVRPDSSDWELVSFFEGKSMASINVIDGVIYASSDNSAIYRSSDNGDTWDFSGIPATTKVDMLKRGDNIYASDYNKIYYSSDDGMHWSYFYETGIQEIIITCITEGDSAFYAGTYGKSIWRRPFLSTTDINSTLYEIQGDLIYNIDANTSLTEFKSNVSLGYGTSIEVEQTDTSGRTNNTSGRVKQSDYIAEGDNIRIVAEDGKNVRVLEVAKGSLVTSIAEEEKGLDVFPIPTKDKLFISSPQKIKACYISNSVGEKVLVPTLQNSYIDVSNLSHGFYFLTILSGDNKRQVVKFIKE